MFPYINLGFIIIPSYAIFVLLGMIGYVITTILIFEKKEKKEKPETNRILIVSIFGFIALYAFAFIFNSIFHSIEEGKIVLGGITWLGGVLGGFPTTVLLIHYFCPKAKGKALEYFDMLIPGIVLAHAFGRIGCFAGGCCYGAVTNSIFGVSFPEGSTAAHLYPSSTGGSLPVLPTQLFEAAFEFVLFAIMIMTYKKSKSHFLEIYAFAYGVFRFLLEFLRGDDRGATGMLLSPSQLMSIVLIVGGILCLLYKKRLIFNKLHIKMDKTFESAQQGNVLTTKSLRVLRDLKQLCDEGIITEEEFACKKEEILGGFNKQ